MMMYKYAIGIFILKKKRIEKMKKTFSKYASIFLALIMIVTSVSFSFAEGEVNEEVANASVEQNIDEKVVEPTGAPQPFVVTPELSGSSSAMALKLTWDAVTDATSYDVKIWSDDSGAPAAIEKKGLTTNSFSTTGINNAYKYKFQVAAYKAEKPAVESAVAPVAAPEPIVSTGELPHYEFPDLPTSVKATRVSSDDNKIVIEWNGNSGEGQYQMIYGTNTNTAAMKNWSGAVEASAKKYTGNVCVAGNVYVSVRALATGNDAVYEAKAGTPCSAKITLASFVNSVRGISWYAKTRSKTTLYKKGTGKAKIGTIKKGTKVTAIGKYPKKIKKWYTPKRVQVRLSNGKTGWILYKQCKGGVKAAVSKTDYSRTVKENYINSLGLTSATKYLLWASPYTQKMYLFEWSKTANRWVTAPLNGNVKGVRITTGIFSNPTSAGTYKIHKRKKKAVQTKSTTGERYYFAYASYYNGGNAMHTNTYHMNGKAKNKVKKNYQPDTKGCIRMYANDAKWIYTHIGMKTTVKTTKNA